LSKYTAIYQKIWKDKDFLKSSKDEKLIFLYLTTNEAVHISGIYEIPLSTIAYETSIPLATVKKVLGKGSIKNVVYDLENEMVFLVNRLKKYSQGGNPTQVEKGVLKQFQETGKTSLWNMFVEVNPQFKSIFSTVDQPLPKGTLPLPLPLPLPIKDLTNNGTDSDEILCEGAFQNCWNQYPRKAGNKKKAFECFKKSVWKQGRRVNIFLEKMGAYIKSVDDPQYLKHGETFFRNWEDEAIPESIAAKSKKKTSVRHNLDLLKTIDLGGDNDNGRIQAGNGDNVRVGAIGQPGTGNDIDLERIAH